MATFMCSAESISDISDYLYHLATWYDAKLHITLKEECSSEISPGSIFSILFQMNLDALTSKYGLKKAEEMYDRKEMNYISEEEREKKSDVVLFKEFECFLYQCQEPGVQGTNIFNLLCDRLFDLAFYVVREIPEYKEAKWG